MMIIIMIIIKKLKLKSFYSGNRYLIPYNLYILLSKVGNSYKVLKNNRQSNLLVEIKYVIAEFNIRVFISILKESSP